MTAVSKGDRSPNAVRVGATGRPSIRSVQWYITLLRDHISRAEITQDDRWPKGTISSVVCTARFITMTGGYV